MENVPAWHGSVKLTREQAEEALRALGATRNEIKELSRCRLKLPP